MPEEHIDLVSDPESEKTAEGADGEPVTETEQLRMEIEEAKNRTLRAMADLENYRHRMNRQMIEERKYANIDLMRELLPVWDNIGRALDAAAASQNFDSLVEGVQLVHQQLLNVLSKFHCEKIEAKFQPFDPNVHASVAQMPNAEHPANTVIEEVQTGFRLHDRIVRPSQVVLAKQVD